MNNYFIFEGRLASLNEYISACRTNAYIGGAMKRKAQTDIEWAILPYKQKGLLKPITKPCRVKFEWHEKTTKRDLDNISAFGRKIILDSLVSMGILIDDSQKYVCGFEDRFYKDERDYIVVNIEEL